LPWSLIGNATSPVARLSPAAKNLALICQKFIVPLLRRALSWIVEVSLLHDFVPDPALMSQLIQAKTAAIVPGNLEDPVNHDVVNIFQKGIHWQRTNLLIGGEHISLIGDKRF